MKKSIPILLLCCFALYHFGYYGFYFSYSVKIESDWTDKIFNENGKLEERIKLIPLALPYMADQENFQVTNTTFEENGQHYRIIRQRYENDTLEIVYVTDEDKANLNKTLKQWISSLVQDENPDHSGNSILSNFFAKDYSKPENGFQFIPFNQIKQQFTSLIFLEFENVSPGLDSPPPRFS